MRVVVKSELYPKISSTLAEAVAALPSRLAETGLPHTEEHVEHLPIGTIGGAIGTHVGPGAIAVAFFTEK